MGLIDEIGRGPAGVDTDIFIYLIEERPRFLGVIEPLFREADQGRIEITCALSPNSGLKPEQECRIRYTL